MKRNRIALFMLLVCLIGLAACSSVPKPVGEDVIRNDVICQDDTIYSGEMTLISAEIIKRQTNEDQKTDYVWVDICAENENCRYIASCKLSYGLYNDGWLLDNYEVLEDAIEYINGPDPAYVLSRANTYMDGHYAHFSTRNKGVVELVDMYVDGDRCICLFDHAEVMGQSGLLTIHWRFRITFVLDEDGWSSGAWDGTMNDYAYDWDLEGEWTGSNEGENFWMKVHAYDPEEKTVEVEYAFGSLCSEGIETLYIVNQDFWDREMREWSLNADKYEHSGFIDLYPFGAEYTDAGEGSGILADSGETHCWLQRVN